MSSLEQRLAFFAATDALKQIARANTISSRERHENVAEHSWHTTLLSMVFADAAPAGTDHNRVRDLITVHDLVEIHAGDTVVWDNVPEADVRESGSASSISGRSSMRNRPSRLASPGRSMPCTRC
jgi:putative hydrolase of HD superfamily